MEQPFLMSCSILHGRENYQREEGRDVGMKLYMNYQIVARIDFQVPRKLLTNKRRRKTSLHVVLFSAKTALLQSFLLLVCASNPRYPK